LKERAKVLQELKRILKPQGIAIIAYLNSWGLLKTGIVDAPIWYQDISVLRSMLGERTFTGPSPFGFTECYWSTSKSAINEIRESDFEIVSYAGAESFAGGMGDTLEKIALDKPEVYENIVTVAAETCEFEQYRDSTDHLHIVARKKGV
jgi:S-adenosylmethionine-dependent methyltransferase